MAGNHEPAVTVARILRPHGRRGEVAAEILTDFPQRLTQLKNVTLAGDRTPQRPAVVRSCWLSTSRGGQAIFHLEGSDSISDAEKLVGLEVQIPLADRMPLPGGSYYVSDLVGCEVREGANMIGTIRDVDFTGDDVKAPPILVVDSPRGEILIPLAQDICTRVDIAARVIEVALPDGLRDLNQP